MILPELNVVDLATVLAAAVAAAAALYSAYTTKKDNVKKDMLANLTTERMRDVHDIRKWSGIILSEASIALNTKIDDEDEHISTIITAANELWFVFKPVYTIDRDLLFSLKKIVDALLAYYHRDFDCSEKVQKERIAQLATDFRKKAYLYSHADWTCVKNQILVGERSSYTDFNQVHKKIQDNVAELSESGVFSEPDTNIWIL